MHSDLSRDDAQFLREITGFVNNLHDVHQRDAREEYPSDLVPHLRALRLFDACTRNLETYALALEELGRGWLSLIPIVNAHSTSVWSVKNYGTEAQKAYWSPRLQSGETIAALALTEPHAGSDLQKITSSAERVEHGWLIRARKALITHAAHSDLLLILVRTDPNPDLGARGLSLFLLQSGEWTVDRKLDKLGSRGIETVELSVNGIMVPDDRLIGGVPGRGFSQVMDGLEVGRVAVAAAAVGVARSAFWNAVGYVRDREAFGTTLANMPAVRARLGNVATQIAAAKALTLAAARAKQAGGRKDVQAASAKIAAGESAINAALAGMELGGGWAYIEDREFSRFLRDSALFIAGEGSNAVLTDLVGAGLSRSEPDLEWI
ncbi:acyl-CoA dehydrogenase family protein [Microbacterium sp. X-17]|uniref:acyl-CoA dehydrogenase family protein n=1 Tax=Microbacterium sp. X-17 TaxID=3144404 RepID=UPI0031F4E978